MLIVGQNAVVTENGHNTERMEGEVVMRYQCGWNNSTRVSIKVEHRIGATLIVYQIFGPGGGLWQQIDEIVLLQTLCGITVASKRNMVGFQCDGRLNDQIVVVTLQIA